MDETRWRGGEPVPPERKGVPDTSPSGGATAATGAPGSVLRILLARDGVRADRTLDPGDVPPGPEPTGRYTELGEIARGGMGAILRIVDNDIRRPVAMKVILGSGDPSRLERFLAEAQITGQLEHPNIVPVHELGLNPEGRVYFTMKLVRGESLQALLDRLADGEETALREYPLPRLLRVFLKVCDAVGFAHSKSVIHRDLKPDNVMVGKFGEVLVMDWGLAKLVRGPGSADPSPPEPPAGKEPDPAPAEPRLTLEGQAVGTPSYMPPEQAAGRIGALDRRSDVFALGGILYAILTREAPYEGDSSAAVLARAAMGCVVPARKRSPDLAIPAELESVCAKAMAFRPEDRYASAGDLADDVAAWLERRLVSAHRYGPAVRFVRWAQRHPAASLAGGVALVTASLGLGAAGILAQKAATEAARAREKEALAASETSRAEAEKLKAEAARLAEAVARSDAIRARSDLDKGRAVSAVLRGAEAGLGGLYRELRAALFQGAGSGEMSRVWESRRAEVEAFERDAGSDPARRAAWLAVKGWMLSLAFREEEARACWRLARETDPDVTYGWLFECVSQLRSYQALQALPAILFHPGGVGFGTPLPETPEMAGLRAGFEELLEKVARSKVWGECSALEFREAMAGFQSLHGGDPRTAARGLAKALSLPELAWAREEILITRARTRYLLAEFDPGLEDAETVLGKYPECLLALVTKGNLLLGKGAWLEASGKDPRPAYRAAVEALEAAARRAPQAELLRLEGMGRLFLGKAQAARGEDPRPAWLRAIALCDAALRLDPRSLPALETRASSRSELAAFRGRQGEDSDADFALAVADLDLALTLDPASISARVNRGNLRHRRATVSTLRGRDPRKDLALALDDFSAALAADPGMGMAVLGRANARLAAGNARQIHGEDPRDDFRKAVEDYGAALALYPSLAAAYVNRATASTNMGESEAMLGGDPAAWFRKAVEDCGAALRISPDLANAFASRSLAYKGLATALAARGEDPRECFRLGIADQKEFSRRAPGQLRSVVGLGLLYYALGNAQAGMGEDPLPAYEGAAAAFEEVVGKAPGVAEAWSTLGVILTQVGDLGALREGDGEAQFDRAEAAFRKALAIDPSYWMATHGLGLLFERRGRFDEAAKEYSKIASVPGVPPAVRGNLERARACVGLPPWACDLLRAEQEAAAGNYPLARILAERALPAARREAVAADPRLEAVPGRAHYNLACVYSLLSDGRAAPRADRLPVPPKEAARLRAAALEHLALAFENGWTDFAQSRKDGDLEPIRGFPEFERLVREWEEKRKG